MRKNKKNESVEFVEKYLKEIENSKDKNEHTLRTPFENLLNDLNVKNDDIEIIQEDKTTEAGTPDFTIKSKSTGVTIGIVETKKPGVDLNNVLKSEQITKYKTITNNIIVSNYEEFIYLYNDEEKARIKLNKKTIDDFCTMVKGYYSVCLPLIENLNSFTKQLADNTKNFKDSVLEVLEKEKNKEHKSKVFGIYDAVQDIGHSNMSMKEFSSMFAQTITLALLSIAMQGEVKFNNLQEIKEQIPDCFSLIKELFIIIIAITEKKYLEDDKNVKNIIEIYNTIDLKKLKAEFEQGGKDFFIYFYEDFLKEYDEAEKKEKGVYYTPEPIVDFIVSQTSNIVKNELGIEEGLECSDVKLLDFSCGTGTFLIKAFKQALENVDKNSFKKHTVLEHLIKDFYGFELMMPPYLIAQMRLFQLLQNYDYDILSAKNTEKNFGVYLTNTLYDYEVKGNSMFSATTKEGKRAEKIKKETPIQIIIGNPPYNVNSPNPPTKGSELEKMHNTFKPGKEQNIKNLNDDYVKFIAFASLKLSKVEKGAMGIITNNSFLDGITHRAMRCQLMNLFSKIYIVNLHGDAKRDKGIMTSYKDKNVFDIQQGTCIFIGVRNTSTKSEDRGVFYLDLIGPRESKFEMLYQIKLSDFTKLPVREFNEAFTSTAWGAKRFGEDLSYFVPIKEQTKNALLKYGNFWGIKDIFKLFNSGIKSHKDNTKAGDFAMCFTKERVEEILDDFKKLSKEDLEFKYKIDKTGRDWDLNVIYNKFGGKETKEEDIKQVHYRPFDFRYCYYHKVQNQGFISRTGYKIMKHMLKQNLALVFTRGNEYSFVINSLSDSGIVSGWANIAPLYLYEDNMGHEIKSPNFTQDFNKMIKSKFPQATPQDILAFIYASLNSKDYKKEYEELIEMDFCRVNFDVSVEEFNRLKNIGNRLINLTLMNEVPKNESIGCKYTGISESKFDSTLTKVTYEDNKIFINNDYYFEGVSPEVWEYKIGGYQVIKKYLESRKKRVLKAEEINHVINIIKVLSAMIEEIDKV